MATKKRAGQLTPVEWLALTSEEWLERAKRAAKEAFLSGCEGAHL